MADEDSRYFEQYKLAIEMADRVSARRGAANTFFITASAALLATVGSNKLADTASIAGLALAAGWWIVLRSYRDLNRAKWQVIVAMERQLPAQPFSDEWGSLKKDPVRKWRPRYAELSTVERLAPLAFATLFVLGLIGKL